MYVMCFVFSGPIVPCPQSDVRLLRCAADYFHSYGMFQCNICGLNSFNATAGFQKSRLQLAVLTILKYITTLLSHAWGCENSHLLHVRHRRVTTSGYAMGHGMRICTLYICTRDESLNVWRAICEGCMLLWEHLLEQRTVCNTGLE